MTDHPRPVPSLDQLADDPKLADGLPRTVLVDLFRLVRHLEIELDTRLRGDAATAVPTDASPDSDRLLRLKEAAAMLKTSTDSLYAKWKKLPFAFKDPVDGRIKFRLSGIERHIRQRSG